MTYLKIGDPVVVYRNERGNIIKDRRGEVSGIIRAIIRHGFDIHGQRLDQARVEMSKGNSAWYAITRLMKED